MSLRTHGGPDARGAARWDFSTCSNAVGPCPEALGALRAVDASRYPDPASTRVRAALAALHGVDASRILIAASASEFIQRTTAVSALLAPGAVGVPLHAYGDYESAARAWRRPVIVGDTDLASIALRWLGAPSSPLGADVPLPEDLGVVPTVVDAVYAPLRLERSFGLTPERVHGAFVLCSPNKALGLTGVRGAYAIAPGAAAYDVLAWCDALNAAAPSWPLSAHAEAMLLAWASSAVQCWVDGSRAALARWRQELWSMLVARGFELHPSVTPYFCARPPVGFSLERLRARDVAVRDATSFGLAGWWRVSAQPPPAIDALASALDANLATTHAASAP